MSLANIRLRTRIREYIVKLCKFPDCIREYDNHILCKYERSKMDIDFYSDYIIVTKDNDSERVTYFDMKYLNTMIEVYEENPPIL